MIKHSKIVFLLTIVLLSSSLSAMKSTKQTNKRGLEYSPMLIAIAITINHPNIALLQHTIEHKIGDAPLTSRYKYSHTQYTLKPMRHIQRVQKQFNPSLHQPDKNRKRIFSGKNAKK